MLVLRPVVDDDKAAGSRNDLDEAVKKGLGLAVDPVQVLEEDDERLDLALSEQRPPNAVAQPLAVGRGVEALPLRFLGGHVEQPADWSEARFQGSIEREELPGDLVPDLPGIVSCLKLKVAFEKVDDREVWARPAVRHRVRFQNQTIARVVGVSELPYETGFAYPRLAHNGHHLATARTRLLQGLEQHLHLSVAANKPREPARRGRLKTRSHRGGAS